MANDLVRLSPPTAPKPAAPPDPVQRHDGITPERQRTFLEALSSTGSVAEAARQAGVSRQAFYSLRNRSGSKAFREAWDRAMGHAIQILGDTAFQRAIEGVEEPVFWKGEQIGTRRRYNDRLLMFLLRVRDPLDFAPLSELRDFRRGPTLPVTSFDTLLARLGEPSGRAPAHRTDGPADRHSLVSTSSTSIA
jgi:hypothetical protein